MPDPVESVAHRPAPSRILPERQRDGPSRFGNFLPEDHVFARDCRHASGSVPSQRALLQEVTEKELLHVNEQEPIPEVAFPPGITTEYTGSRDPFPDRLAFGRLENGTFAGFRDENARRSSESGQKQLTRQS